MVSFNLSLTSTFKEAEGTLREAAPASCVLTAGQAQSASCASSHQEVFSCARRGNGKETCERPADLDLSAGPARRIEMFILHIPGQRTASAHGHLAVNAWTPCRQRSQGEIQDVGVEAGRERRDTGGMRKRDKLMRNKKERRKEPEEQGEGKETERRKMSRRKE